MLTAKPVVTNKFWIVEKDGAKIATIQMAPDCVVLVHPDNQREKFASVNLLKDKYNIEFTKSKRQPKLVVSTFSVNGYPCEYNPCNSLFDVAKKLPLFTKTAKSKCYFCAGYYAIKFNQNYVMAYCPKLITLNRYQFKGPFMSKGETKDQMKLLHKIG